MISYQNPWHRPLSKDYGPAFYITDAEPVEYKGYLIYHRTALVWDIVKDGVCLSQYAGPNGARRFVDSLSQATEVNL